MAQLARGHGAAAVPLARSANGRDWPVTKTLDYFDGIFFCGLREILLGDQQFADLLSFVLRARPRSLVVPSTRIVDGLRARPGSLAADRVRNDPDLDPLRDDPRVAALVAGTSG